MNTEESGSKRRVYPESIRQIVLTAHEEGENWRKLAQTLGISLRSARYWVANKTHNIVRTKMGGHKKPLLNDAEQNRLLDWFMEDTNSTLPQLQARTKAEMGKTVSRATISTYLRKKFTIGALKAEGDAIPKVPLPSTKCMRINGFRKRRILKRLCVSSSFPGLRKRNSCRTRLLSESQISEVLEWLMEDPNLSVAALQLRVKRVFGKFVSCRRISGYLHERVRSPFPEDLVLKPDDCTPSDPHRAKFATLNPEFQGNYRPKKLTLAEIDQVAQWRDEDPSLSLRNLRSLIEEKFNKKVGLVTISAYLKRCFAGREDFDYASKFARQRKRSSNGRYISMDESKSSLSILDV